MAKKITDGFIDDLPETLSLEDENDVEAAFWDEFFYMEQKDLFDRNLYTITIEDELTGEKRTIKHVQLSKMGRRKQRLS